MTQRTELVIADFFFVSPLLARWTQPKLVGEHGPTAHNAEWKLKRNSIVEEQNLLKEVGRNGVVLGCRVVHDLRELTFVPQ